MPDSSGPASSGFRFETASTTLDRAIPRAGLTALLRGRFQHRLTVITGVAGYGKTTAMALAIEANQMEPLGTDVWLSTDEFDAEPLHLLDGLCRALGLSTRQQASVDIEQIVSEVWRRAPDDLALMLDDVQHLRTP
jgi:LuxR family transcriptional regulator, maltose regulon positive regulatory protein